MRSLLLAAAALALAGPAAAQPLPSGEHPVLREVAAAVSAERQHAIIARLVGFGTRHTLSETKSDRRGIGAARRWVAAEFAAMSKDCGGCLTIATPSAIISGQPRIPDPTEVMDVLAIQKGTTDPNRVIVISGHIDSRVTDPMNFTSDAPGANDDGSGVAAVMEAARVLSRHKFPATLVFAVTSGEEQGLNGGKVLADYARAQGWRVEAALNNDIVGSTDGMAGVIDNSHVRIFSEGTKAVETDEDRAKRRRSGSEVDAPSRQIARFMDRMADQYLVNLDAVMVYRVDRYGRGGDQVPMQEAGFPAIRVTQAQENYDKEHQDLRTVDGRRYGDTLDGVDFPYLAQVTRLNVVTMAALASAPVPPEGVDIEGQVSADTTVKWQAVPGAAGYRVWWRGTTDPQWRFSRWAGDATSIKLPGVNIDDWYFGVSAVGADGFESPVVFPGASGAFVSPAPTAKP